MVPAAKLEGEYSFLGKNSLLDQSEGVKTHLYYFGAEQHVNADLGSFVCVDQGSPSLLDTIILSQWDDFASRGHLDYDVTACKLKVIDGGKGFVVQLNDKWNSVPLKEYDKFFKSFGCLKPDFTKSCEGLLLCIAQGEKDGPEVVPSTAPPKDGLLLIANAYPIEYGHIFMVPSALDEFSYSWDKRILGLAMKSASEVNNAAFRVFVNNDTSIMPDRMFFQACYFANPLPVECASTVAVYDGKAGSGVSVSELVDYPLKALVFTGSNLNTLASVVGEISFSLQGDGTAHNLLISNNGAKVFLFPQVKNLVTGCFLSAWDCGGYFIYRNKYDFDKCSEMELSDRMASVSLQDGAFEDLKCLCCAIADE